MALSEHDLRDRQWPAEPAVFDDFPTLLQGQSLDDWTVAQDDWTATLSPGAAKEVLAYRSSVNVYLRTRSWGKRRQLVVECALGMAIAIALSIYFVRFQQGVAETSAIFLPAPIVQIARDRTDNAHDPGTQQTFLTTPATGISRQR